MEAQYIYPFFMPGNLSPRDISFPLFVEWMCLAGNDELDGSFRMSQHARQSLRIMDEQIGTLVACELAGYSQGQDVGIQFKVKLSRMGKQSKCSLTLHKWKFFHYKFAN
jgi:hypothetical protein